MFEKGAGMVNLRASAMFWCRCFFMLGIAFFAGLFTSSHASTGASMNPAFKHLGSTLGLIAYIVYLALIACVFWIPAGVFAGVVFSGRHRLMSRRTRLVTTVGCIALGFFAGTCYAWLSPSSVHRFLP
jgi:hypothetical protein